jgi:hypothetical protein
MWDWKRLCPANPERNGQHLLLCELVPKKNTCVSLFIGYLPYKNGPYMALSENSVVPNSMVDDHVSVQIRSAILAYAPLFDGNFPRHMLIHMIHVR